jgi:excisionase family DNA binding protein
MVQGYYTLEEASRILGMDQDTLNQMAQRREIRAFADRGTWRFRTQDVEEMARRMGLGSSPDLQLGEVDLSKPPSSGPKSTPPRPATPPPSSKTTPRPATPPPAPRSGTRLTPPPGPKTPRPGPSQPKAPPRPKDEEAFDFSHPIGEDESSDQDIVIESPAGQKYGTPTPRSPKPKPGSDSDVHLVFDVGSDYPTNDSDVKLEDSGTKLAKGASSRHNLAGPEAPKSAPKKKGPASPSRSVDSGVRLVPMDDDSAVPLNQPQPPTTSDSDIRLAPATPGPIRLDSGRPHETSQTTEDINLDEELRRAEEMARARKPRSKAKPKTDVKRPEPTPTSPFGLAETDLQQPALPPADDDKTAELRLDSDESVSLGEFNVDEHPTGSTHVGQKGVQPPAGAEAPLEGLEESSDSLEFELSLEPEATPRPAQESAGVDSSGEFELTLDEGGAPASGSDSDQTQHEDSGEVAEDKDIFETDFDMPALEEDSGSDAVALEGEPDTQLESSDFDLSLGEEESGSQVVALEGEEADEGAETVAYQGRRPAEGEEEAAGEAEELLAEDEAVDETAEGLEEEEELRPRRAAVAAPAADWGPLPVILMLPCTIVMLLLAFMSFELLHNMWGYQQPSKPGSMLVTKLADLFGQKVPD